MPTSHELTKLDLPESIELHREIVRSKRFLLDFYRANYEFYCNELKSLPLGSVLEIGSGGGFANDYIPGLITSDIRFADTLSVVCSGVELPFKDSSLRGVLMTNVFHHIQRPAAFLASIERVLLPGGKLIMVEPANSLWSQFIYSKFHHEPFEPKAVSWDLPLGGPMTMANGALPWIVFERDREEFERLFPGLKIERIEYFGPILYLLSGGLSQPQLLPGAALDLIKLLERILSPLARRLGLFSRIVLRKMVAPKYERSLSSLIR